MKFRSLKDRIDEIKTRRFKENVEGLRGHNAKPLEDLFSDLTSRTVKEILNEIMKVSFSYEPTSNVYHNEARFRLYLLKELSKLGFEEEIKTTARNLSDHYMDLGFNFKGEPPHTGTRDNDIKSTIDCLILAHTPKEELCSLGDKLFKEHKYEWENAINCFKAAESLERIVEVGKAYLGEGDLDEAYKAFNESQADKSSWKLFEKKADEFISLVEQGSSEFGYRTSVSTLKDYYLKKGDKEKIKKIIILNARTTNYLPSTPSTEDEKLFESLNPLREEYEKLAEACLRSITDPEVAIRIYKKTGTKPDKEKFTKAMKRHINNKQVLSGVAKYLVAFPDINAELFKDLYDGIITSPHCWVRDVKEINNTLKTVNRQVPQNIILQHASYLLKESPYYPSTAIELYEKFNLKPDIKGIENAIDYCLETSKKCSRGYERKSYEDRAIGAYEYLERIIKP